MIVPRLSCENRLMRKDRAHSARPTAIRSVLRYVQPIAARTKATRARRTRITLKFKLMPSIFLDSGRRKLAEAARRHQPGENVHLEPSSPNRRVVRHEGPRSLDRRPEDADATPGFVRLAGKGSADQSMAGLAHPGVESHVIPLQCLELDVAHLGRVLRPAQQDDGVRVQLHGKLLCQAATAVWAVDRSAWSCRRRR